MKSIVIFGGAGFVGKHLIRRLTKNGHKIIVPYQRSVQEAKIRLLGVTGQVIPFRYSSLEDKRLKSVLNNADLCINLKTTYDEKKGGARYYRLLKLGGTQQIDVIECELKRVPKKLLK